MPRQWHDSYHESHAAEQPKIAPHTIARTFQAVVRGAELLCHLGIFSAFVPGYETTLVAGMHVSHPHQRDGYDMSSER